MVNDFQPVSACIVSCLFYQIITNKFTLTIDCAPITQHRKTIESLSTGMEITCSTRPPTQVSVKMSWASANCRFFAAFLKVTRPMASAVKIKFPTLRLMHSVLSLAERFTCHYFV